jgi:hypothetical protein
MAIWELWNRSRLLAIVVAILVVFTIANAIWITFNTLSPVKIFVDSVAAGTVVRIMVAERILRNKASEGTRDTSG